MVKYMEYGRKKQNNRTKKNNFGSAEFRVICDTDVIRLVIHGNHVVARSKKDNYKKLFDFCVKQLGGRIDT
jgi:hypothetical protein